MQKFTAVKVNNGVNLALMFWPISCEITECEVIKLRVASKFKCEYVKRQAGCYIMKNEVKKQ